MALSTNGNSSAQDFAASAKSWAELLPPMSTGLTNGNSSAQDFAASAKSWAELLPQMSTG